MCHLRSKSLLVSSDSVLCNLAIMCNASGLLPLVVMFQLALERDLSCEISNFRVFIVLLKKSYACVINIFDQYEGNNVIESFLGFNRNNTYP